MSENVMPLSEARAKFKELIESNSRTLITRHGYPVAYIVPAREMEAMEETMAILSDPNTLTALQKSLEDIKAGRVIDHAELKAELY